MLGDTVWEIQMKALVQYMYIQIGRILNEKMGLPSFSFSMRLLSWWVVARQVCCTAMVSSARHGLAVAKHLWLHVAIVKLGLSCTPIRRAEVSH